MIGAAIHGKMPWAPFQKKIYPVMGNAGGHTATEAIEQFCKGFISILEH